jgi:hypothetical protein
LSKSSGDTGVRDLRASGHSAAEVIALAATAVGYAGDVGDIVGEPVERRGSGVSHNQ